MDFLEKDLETILYNAPQNKIKEKGLRFFVYDKIFRQVLLGTYGVADLITVRYVNKSIHITIYELKNKILNAAVFWQILKYIKGVHHCVSKFNLSNHYVNVSAVMIGRTVDTSGEFCFLPTLDSMVHIYTYDYNYDGITFNYVHDVYERLNFNGIDIEQFEQDTMFSFGRSMLSNFKSLPEEILTDV